MFVCLIVSSQPFLKEFCVWWKRVSEPMCQMPGIYRNIKYLRTQEFFFEVLVSETRTLLTVITLECRSTNTDSADTFSVVGTGGINTLAFLHLTLRPLPASVTHAYAFFIISITTTQYWTRVWNTQTYIMPTDLMFVSYVVKL